MLENQELEVSEVSRWVRAEGHLGGGDTAGRASCVVVLPVNPPGVSHGLTLKPGEGKA